MMLEDMQNFDLSREDTRSRTDIHCE